MILHLLLLLIGLLSLSEAFLVSIKSRRLMSSSSPWLRSMTSSSNMKSVIRHCTSTVQRRTAAVYSRKPNRSVSWTLLTQISSPCMLTSFQGGHRRRGLCATASASTESPSTYQQGRKRKRVAIVGGGLAGLSTTFHLLKKTMTRNQQKVQQQRQSQNIQVNMLNSSIQSSDVTAFDIEILDIADVGTSGASSVAGGLLHPLSPRGKLVPLGLEGLASTNELLRHAVLFEPECVLRNELYRIALTDQHVTTLEETAQNLPNLTEWLDYDRANSLISKSMSKQQGKILGALRLFGGCQVIHVPSYLKGLWSACCSLATNDYDKADSVATVSWSVEPELSSPDFDWSRRLAEYDTVVLSAGAGMFRQQLDDEDSTTSNLLQPGELPATLVRGQSIELCVDSSSDNDSLPHALLCGKYVSPLPQKNRIMIGATHEFQPQPWDEQRVEDELKELSYPFASHVWDPTRIIDRRITSGIRVQSNRGTFGRFPMIGKYDSVSNDGAKNRLLHDNVWLFTGLSSRGLLYHGMFGDMLTNQILQRDNYEHYASKFVDHLEWWKR